ncbi:protein bric-a-brac 1-like isoform X7 [Schistocerca nitens]|uniref:protein bric-a-brac 1-like isoform X7 n=1 Tax=Schistocerca nitens TaxID=7011 RepID=UPI0021185B9D|nr:protein bric-a-brac 1-like isoform X7 [Schistocerca nitens]
MADAGPYAADVLGRQAWNVEAGPQSAEALEAVAHAYRPRPRKSNFTAREVSALLAAVREQRAALLQGVAGGREWAEGWRHVAAAVSAADGLPRSETDVRKKWTYLKWEARNTSKPDRDPVSRAVLHIVTGADADVPQQMPGTSGGPGGGGGGAGGGGQQSAKQSVGQQMAMLKKQVGQPGTMQQHGANKATGPPRRAVSPSPPQSPQVAPPEVCLRWNSYHSNMQATFPSLLTNEQFVDVTLACEGRSIKCHKVILSACSSYFEGLLSENPCQHPIVLMKDLRYWEVQALVDFMYRGEVNVGQDKLPSLLAAAEALQIKGLAGPASTPSSQDEDSMPATIEDFLDEQVPSPITERRMRKRRMMGSPQQQPIRPQHIQQQQQQQQHHHQQQQQQQQHQQLQQQQQQHQHQPRHQQLQSHSQPHPQPQPQRHVSLPSSTSSVGQSSMGRVQRQQQPQQLPARNPPNSIPSTSGYRHEQPMSEAAPPRKQRRSEPLPEVKIEPIDIDLSNDSMDEEFVEKKFTPPTEAKDDGGGAETVTEPVTEQKPDIETENFSATELSNVQEMQDYPFEPGSNSCGAKSENIAEATSDSPFGSSPGGDDVNSRDAPGED